KNLPIVYDAHYSINELIKDVASLRTSDLRTCNPSFNDNDQLSLKIEQTKIEPTDHLLTSLFNNNRTKKLMDNLSNESSTNSSGFHSKSTTTTFNNEYSPRLVETTDYTFSDTDTEPSEELSTPSSISPQTTTDPCPYKQPSPSTSSAPYTTVEPITKRPHKTRSRDVNQKQSDSHEVVVSKSTSKTSSVNPRPPPSSQPRRIADQEGRGHRDRKKNNFTNDNTTAADL
ncbi:unnamed protein product, partial [Rotaria sordida]